MVDNAVIPDDFMDIREDVVSPRGLYHLRIVDAELKTSKKGNLFFGIQIENMDEPDSAFIFYCLNIPTRESHKLVKQEFKRFITYFNIVFDPPNLIRDDLVGAVADTVLNVEEYEEGKFKNVLNLPKLEE